MKDTRAIVLGLVVVAAIALIWAVVRRPAPGMKRVRAFRVEIHGEDHGKRRDVSVRIPGFLVGRAAQIASRAWEEGRHRGSHAIEFDGSTVTPREILEAADQSTPGHPGSIDVDHGRGKILVSPEGSGIRFSVRNEEGNAHAEILVPRVLVERLAQDEPISPREILEKIDEMGPGDLVSIRGEQGEIRVSAEAR